MDIFSLLGLMLTVLALGLSIWQFREAKHQTTKLKAIGDSVSTRYLGEFPDFLPEIINVLKNAQNKVVIVCDFPTYGRFSKPEIWLDYKNIIEKMIEGGKVSVSFVCMESESRVAFSRKQFFHAPPNEEQWQKYCSKPAFCANLEKLLKRNGQELGSSLPSFNELIELLEKEDEKMLLTTFANLQYSSTPNPMPLYFWIADDKNCVFSFPSYESDKSEFGFMTSDQKLIASFLQVYESYRLGTSDSVL